MNAFKAVFMVDVMLAIVPLLLIIISSLQIMQLQINGIANLKEMNKVKALFLISEYIVKTNAVLENGKRVINKIDDSSLNIDIESLKKNAGLNSLHIGFSSIDDEVCIYRFVYYKGEIKRLFVCGS